MIIGVPRETKPDESRVSMLPVGVHLLVRAGHEVLVERGAGNASGFEDDAYAAAGATLTGSARAVFERAELIIKVKEPQKPELDLLRPGQVVFTYFHFAADADLTRRCLDAGITALAYETLTDERGRLPLLTPMSEVAGRMAVQQGAKYLETPQGGRGVLLPGVPGVEPGRVTVLGGGTVGTQAARIAAGMGANVTLMDINLDRLRYLDEVMPANVHTLYSHPHAVHEQVTRADLVIGAVLIPGAKAPNLVPRAMLKDMHSGAVIVDVAVDQGGCVETTRPTTHAEPTFVIDGVVHYGVANIPGAVGRTSTQALCHATQPYVLKLANRGAADLTENDPAFTAALNLRAGQITHPAVAAALSLPLATT